FYPVRSGASGVMRPPSRPVLRQLQRYRSSARASPAGTNRCAQYRRAHGATQLTPHCPLNGANRPFCRLIEISPFTDVHWTANPGLPTSREDPMRLAPILLAALLFGASFVATSVLSVSAAEFGTRDEAIAMVRRVQEKFRKDGPDATFKAINSK